MVAYTKPQQWKNEESERLRGEGDKMKFIYLAFERGQVAGFRKGGRKQVFDKLPILGTNDGLWDRVLGLGSETWKRCKS